MAEQKKSFWKRFVSWLSGLKNIFRFRRKKDSKQEQVQEKPKDVPVINDPPRINKETRMEFRTDPKEKQFEDILDQAEKAAKKQKEPEPPKELLSDQEAKNAARMLPVLMALNMETTGPKEKKVKKPGSKKWKGPKVGFAAKEKSKKIYRAGKRRSV